MRSQGLAQEIVNVDFVTSRQHLMGVGHVKETMTIKSPERCSGLAHLSTSKTESETEDEEQSVQVVPLPDAIPLNRYARAQ